MTAPSHKKTTIAYWLTTVLFLLPMVLSSVGYFTNAPDMVNNMTALNYPLYLMTILGIAKLSGTVAILQPKFIRIKEWAYAGFSINLIGASLSHALNGDPAGKIFPPILILGLVLASYTLWHKKLSLVTKSA